MAINENLQDQTQVFSLQNTDILYLVRPTDLSGSPEGTDKKIAVADTPWGTFDTPALGYEPIETIADFNALVAAGVPNENWIITADITLISSPTLPSNTTLHFNGGVIDLDGFTLTGDSTIINADITQIFSLNAGTVDGTWFVPIIYVEWFGAVNDLSANGVTDSSDAIQAALNFGSGRGNVIASQEYFLDFDNVDSAGVLIPANTHFTINGSLKGLTTNKSAYRIIEILDIANVIIDGNGLIDGKKANNTSNTPLLRSGHGIIMGRGCDNVQVKGLTFKDNYGDGITITSFTATDETQPTNILIDGVTCDGNNRNGLTVTSVKGLRVLNSTFIRTGIDYRTTIPTNPSGGVAPATGIDIEPNGDSVTTMTGNKVEDVFLSNNRCIDNGGGGLLITGNDNYSYTNNIKIQGLTCHGNQDQALLIGGKGVHANFYVSDVDITQTPTANYDTISIEGQTAFGIYPSRNIENVFLSNVVAVAGGTLNTGSILTLVRCDNVSLKNLDLFSEVPQMRGINISDSAARISIDNVRVDSLYSSLSSAFGAGELKEDVTIINSYFRSTLDDRSVNLNNFKNLTFNNNIVNGSYRDGCYLTNIVNSKFENNTIKNTSFVNDGTDTRNTSGFYFFSSKDCFISNNTIKDAEEHTGKLQIGIHLDVASRNNIVQDNKTIGLFTKITAGVQSNLKAAFYNAGHGNIITDSSILTVGTTIQKPIITDNTLPIGFLYWNTETSSQERLRGRASAFSLALTGTTITIAGNLTITLEVAGVGTDFVIPLEVGQDRTAIVKNIMAVDFLEWTATNDFVTLYFTRQIVNVPIVTASVASTATGVTFTRTSLVVGVNKIWV